VVKTVSTIEVETKKFQNSFETVLKLFCFSQNSRKTLSLF